MHLDNSKICDIIFSRNYLLEFNIRNLERKKPMAYILNVNQEDPIIHLKAYGGVQIYGTEAQEVQCDISSPQLATLVEEDGHVYVTVNKSCVIKVPQASTIEIEKGMGSVKIANIKNMVNIGKVLGNLVLSGIKTADVGKVGGNFSINKAEKHVQIEKVAGNLTVEDVASFKCEKVGGNCRIKNVSEWLTIEKAGGNFLGQSIRELAGDVNIGGFLKAHSVQLRNNVNVGGNIKLNKAVFTDGQSLNAGGNIDVVIEDQLIDTVFKLRAGDGKIEIKIKGDDIKHMGGTYEYQIGEAINSVTLAAGGAIKIGDQQEAEEEIVGDLSGKFEFEESPFSELIQERIDSATKMAEAKVKSTEIRLEQIREKLEKSRGFDFDIDFGDIHKPTKRAEEKVTHIHRKAGKKGATDEERLMILQMLQDKKISVEEAETLFKALEE
jgi:hypothetical protein